MGKKLVLFAPSYAEQVQEDPDFDDNDVLKNYNLATLDYETEVKYESGRKVMLSAGEDDSVLAVYDEETEQLVSSFLGDDDIQGAAEALE